MIQVFKIVTGKCDIAPVLTMNINMVTRGNTYKLLPEKNNYDLRKFCFNTVVNIFESLPNTVVDVDSIIYLNRNLINFGSISM